MKEFGVSSLPSSISAMRSLRILRVNESVYPDAHGPEVRLPASLTALSGTLRALSISMVGCQAPLLQLTFLTRVEVLSLAEDSEAAPLQRAFKHLREVGSLQLVENPDLGLDGKWHFQPCCQRDCGARGTPHA